MNFEVMNAIDIRRLSAAKPSFEILRFAFHSLLSKFDIRFYIEPLNPERFALNHFLISQIAFFF